MLDCFDSASPGLKHHYIPVFYLKNWTGPDRKLCEFSRPYREVKAQRKHPSATGYECERVLNWEIMQQVDQQASNVLKVLVSDSNLTFGIKEKIAWSHFILSLIQRAPERVAWFCENYDRMRRDELARIQNSPPVQAASHSIEKARVIRAMSSLPKTIAHITYMRWHVVHIDNAPYRLLTSDQPVIMSNGLQYPKSYILCPVSPAHLFVATNELKVEREMDARIRSGRLIRDLNHHVCSQAQKYVYDVDDTQLRFVENRLEKSTKRGTRPNQGSFPL